MKALAKDRRRRYQSACDMQLDIDTFLSNNEFTPSNIHLANFMKQLFHDEIAAEKEQQKIASTLTAAELLQGFSDDDFDPLTVTGLTANGGGTIVAQADGSWQFIPTAGFVGPVELSYTVDDGHGLSIAGQQLFVVKPPNSPGTGSVVIVLMLAVPSAGGGGSAVRLPSPLSATPGGIASMPAGAPPAGPAR
jgi:hypothetical protein